MALPAGGFRSIHLQHELRYYLAGYKNIEGFDLATVTFDKAPFGKWSESETGEKSLQVRKGTFVCRCLVGWRKLGQQSISFSLGFSILELAIRLDCLDRFMGISRNGLTAVILRGSTLLRNVGSRRYETLLFDFAFA